MALNPQGVTVYGHERPDGTFFVDDFSITLVVDGSGSIAGWTIEMDVFAPNGTPVTGATVSITDAAAREVTAVFSGMDLELGLFNIMIFRTDTGLQTEVAWGSFWVVNAR